MVGKFVDIRDAVRWADINLGMLGVRQVGVDGWEIGE